MPVVVDPVSLTEWLLTLPHLPLRERTLWRMLYETAARAEEVLGLDVAELDLRNRRAKMYRKGGRAAECFAVATEALPGGPRTLHQLRHSALSHSAEDGANTSTLLALSGHTSVVSLPATRGCLRRRWPAGGQPATRRPASRLSGDAREVPAPGRPGC